MKETNITTRLFCLLLVLLTSSTLLAQTKGRILGRIVTVDGNPMELVTVGLKGTDKGVYTNEHGKFSLEAEAGSYILEVRYLGNKPIEQAINIIAKEKTYIGQIVYDLSGSELDEVIVDGRNKMTQKNSTYVSRMPLSYIENPQVYTVIPKELISTQVSMNMEDVLKNVSGASNVAKGFGSGGVGVQIMQRGFSSGINMRNGMSTNSLALTDPVNIERIEAIKGPSGTLFGTTVSYGGLINKVTKKPFDRQDFSFSYTAGSWSNNRFTADINTPLNRNKTFLLRLNSLYATGNSYMQGTPPSKSWAIDPSITYVVNDRLTLNLDLEIFHNEGLTSFLQIGNEKNLYEKQGISSMKDLKYDWKRSYADHDLISTTETFNSYFEAVYKLSDNWQSQTAYSHSGVNLESNYFFLNYVTPEKMSRSVNRIPATFDRDQFQQNVSGNFKIGSMKNKLLIGIDYLFTNNDNKRNSVVYDTVSYNQKDVKLSMERVDSLMTSNVNKNKTGGPYGSKTSVYSAYVSDVLNITDCFSVLAALRVDHYKGSSYEQTSFSPKFGAVYEIVKDELSVFANFLDGFRNNGSSASDEDGTLKDWKPEHATQLEGGFKAQLFNQKLVATVGIYNIKVKDILRSIYYTTSAGVAGTYNVQDGERLSKGFDIDITALPLPGWTLIAGYGYNDSKYQKTSIDKTGNTLDGKRPGNLPLHSANFWTDYKLMQGSLKGLGLGVGGNFIGKTYYSDNNYIYNPNRFTLDASLYYAQPKYRLSLKLNNVLNDKNWTLGRGAQPVKTREVLGSVSFRL